jgi:hypothetical protein
MLIHGSDKEKAFDLAVQRSFPYLIFPPIHDSYEGLDYDEFRNKLINNLVALYNYKNSNDDVTFYKQNEEIRNMLEYSVFDRTTITEIESYKYQQMTVDNAIREMAKNHTSIEGRLLSIEKKIKRKGKFETPIENLELPIENLELPSAANENNVYKYDNDLSNKDNVLKYLKYARDPKTLDDLIDLNIMDAKKIYTVLYELRKQRRNKPENIRIVEYISTWKNGGDKVDYTYQWVDDPEEK